MNPRLDNLFASLRREGRTGLAAYLVAGDPDASTSLAAMETLVGSGVALLEVGMPFSDPVADGPIVAKAHERALRGRQTLPGVLELVSRFRERDATTPVVLMGYVNPVLNFGVESFFRDASRRGVDGVIVVDLPLEHAAPWETAAATRGVALVPLLAPTASEERERQILLSADGLVYMVTRTGITGPRGIDVDGVKERLRRVRQASSIPVAAGFGIRSAEQARALAGAVDLVVVGSLFVETLARGGEGALEALGTTARELAAALGTP